MEQSAAKQHFVPDKTFSRYEMVQGNATRACATHANAIQAKGNPWSMRPRQNITLLPKHGGIVAAVGRIFVKNMRVTR